MSVDGSLESYHRLPRLQGILHLFRDLEEVIPRHTSMRALGTSESLEVRRGEAVGNAQGPEASRERWHCVTIEISCGKAQQDIQR